MFEFYPETNTFNIRDINYEATEKIESLLNEDDSNLIVEVVRTIKKFTKPSGSYRYFFEVSEMARKPSIKAIIVEMSFLGYFVRRQFSPVSLYSERMESFLKAELSYMAVVMSEYVFLRN